MFIPHNSNEWCSLDWSNQEGRLAAHYASLVHAKGADQLVSLWDSDPALDLHKQVASKIFNVERSQVTPEQKAMAKTVNLGLLYSLGEANLCKQLGLPTVWTSTEYGPREVAGLQGKQFLASYHQANPWLKELNTQAKNTRAMNGGVSTIGGRFLQRDDPRFDYRALNNVIQGSAADQMLLALKRSYDAGIPILNIVHDEFNVEGIENAKLMKEIMEARDIYGKHLTVPMYVESKFGPNWGDLTEVKK